jgi:hypothetical protein
VFGSVGCVVGAGLGELDSTVLIAMDVKVVPSWVTVTVDTTVSANDDQGLTAYENISVM